MASVDIQSAVARHSDVLLYALVGRIDGHTAGIQLHLAHIYIEGAGIAVAINIGERGDLVAAAVHHVGVVEGHALGQIHCDFAAEGAGIGGGHAFRDPAHLGIGFLIGGLHSLNEAAVSAGAGGLALVGHAGLLDELPLGEVVIQGSHVGTGIVLHVVADGAHIEGLAVAVFLTLCVLHVGHAGGVAVHGVVVVVVGISSVVQLYGVVLGAAAALAGVEHLAILFHAAVIVVAQHGGVVPLVLLAAGLALELGVATLGAGGCNDLDLQRAVGLIGVVVADGIYFRCGVSGHGIPRAPL